MSDTTNPAPSAGEPPVPPVTPPPAPTAPPTAPPAPPAPPAPAYGAPGYPVQSPPAAPAYPQAGGYAAQGAPGLEKPPVAPAYGQVPPGGYQTPPPGYQPPVQQPYYGGYPQAATGPAMNTLAIITIILAFVFSPAGIVTGHIGLKQIDRTGEAGRGLAKAGLILSYVFTGFWLLIVVTSIVLPIIAAVMYSAAYPY